MYHRLNSTEAFFYRYTSDGYAPLAIRIYRRNGAGFDWILYWDIGSESPLKDHFIKLYPHPVKSDAFLVSFLTSFKEEHIEEDQETDYEWELHLACFKFDIEQFRHAPKLAAEDVEHDLPLQEFNVAIDKGIFHQWTRLIIAVDPYEMKPVQEYYYKNEQYCIGPLFLFCYYDAIAIMDATTLEMLMKIRLKEKNGVEQIIDEGTTLRVELSNGQYFRIDRNAEVIRVQDNAALQYWL